MVAIFCMNPVYAWQGIDRNSEQEKITSASQFCILMFLWLTLEHIALLDCLGGIKMFEKRGKTND